MSQPLHVHSSNEVRYFLLATPCEACGGGPCVLHAVVPGRTPEEPALARATCQACRSGRILSFISEYEPADADSPCISPVDEPSSVVDLDQWLGLYYQLHDLADRQEDAHRARQMTIEASLCLGEALKFYGDDELPPESAFFTEATLLAFREHPQNFPRQLLRDLQAKLPPAPAWPE